jgi:hypothetical protein
MRSASLLGVLTLMFVLAGSIRAADGPPDVRTVISPQAQVWCGPSTSDGLYPTNLLRQGDRVQVIEELPSGWLAVRPPAGSFSWINTRFLQHIAAKYTNYVVAYEGYPVPVLIGSSLKTDRPSKIGVKLPRGAQVRGIGHTRTDNEGTWLPIEPPDGEVRYIRTEDVANPRTPIRTTVAAAGSAQPAASSIPPPPPDGDALWRDAEKAERAGRMTDAIRLYRLAGDANLAVNRARADEAYRRAHWLQQANPSTNAPGGSYYYPDRGAAASQTPASATRLIGSSGSGAPAGQLVSTQSALPPWGTPQVGGNGTAEIGRLRSGSRHVGDQRIYLLMNNQDRPKMYVIAQQGVDLTSFIDRNVQLWGPIVYNNDLRGYLLTATQAREMP